MTLAISPLPLDAFSPLFDLDDAALAALGARRVVVDAKPGYPCRITLDDAEVGETVLLINYEHQPANTPFRAAHAIYVRQAARAAWRGDAVPPALARRLLSVRAFDAEGMMTDADVVDGQDLPALAERLLADPAVAYLHAHYAKPGCYAARIDRA
ncbi:MAG: hypothetical protein JWP92_3092 [Caulobacter sp.]|nr:hypothetical protein [Caulobacter sp.]